jgi:hypothetical protein
MQQPSYLLRCTPPISNFMESLISFDYSLLQVFGCLLGLRSFDNPKGCLVHKQASLPITFGGIKFILTTTMIPTTYLWSWALVASIIVVRFMVDQRPFLFEALTLVNNNTFPFHQHLKVICDFRLPLVHACFPLFEQLIRQQMVWLQDSIWKHLHHHTLSSMFFDGIF